MLRHHLHNYNCDYEGQVSRGPVQMNGRRVWIRSWELCALLRTSGSVEYLQLFVVVCNSVGEIVSIISKIFLGLRQVTCLLLPWKTSSQIGTESIPDILKDLSVKNTVKNRMDPDVIFHTPRRRTSHGNRRVQPDDRREINSREDHNTDSTKCGTPSYSHLRQSSNNSHLHHNHNGDNSAGRHLNDYRTDGCDVVSHRHYTGSEAYCFHPRNNNSRLFTTEHCRSSVIHTDRTLNLQRSSSDESTNNQRFHGSLRELSNHRQSVTYRVTSPRPRSGTRHVHSETVTSQEGTAYSQASVRREDQALEFDREIAKDIIRALRTIGDDLDAKMRHNNERFPQAVFDAFRVDTGRFLLTTLKHHNLMCVAFDASLALLKFIRQ